MHLLASAFHLLSSVIVYLQYMRDASTGGAEMADSIKGRVSEGRGRRHHKACFSNATHRSSHVSWRYVLRGGREGREGETYKVLYMSEEPSSIATGVQCT